MKTISRYIMTLVLLLTAVTGAWAQSYEAKVFDVPASWTEDETNLSAADLPKDFVQITKDEAKALAVPDGNVVLIYGFVGENVLMMTFENGTAIPDDDDDGAPEVRAMIRMFQTFAKVCYTAPAGPKVAWNASTKTGTFTMPDADVELTPIYEPEYTATFVASNTNTIKDGKATVKLDGSDATPDADGKLTPIYEGQTITLTAAAGYKFRKVEVKKGEKLQSITIGSVTLVYVEGDKWSKIVERNSDKLHIENNWIWSDYGVLMGSDYVDPNSPINTSLQYRWDG